MPLIDLTRQTNLTVDAGSTLDVPGSIDVAKDGLEIASASVTTTAAELNILDGVLISVTELNYLQNLQSNVQQQIDNLISGVTPFEGDVDFGGGGNPVSVRIWGDLTVLGSGIIFDTAQIQVEDPIIQVNYINNVAQTGTDGGIQVGRSATDDAQMI